MFPIVAGENVDDVLVICIMMMTECCCQRTDDKPAALLLLTTLYHEMAAEIDTDYDNLKNGPALPVQIYQDNNDTFERGNG